MKKPAGMKTASYDHNDPRSEDRWSHLVGIPCRLKDPPYILYHN